MASLLALDIGEKRIGVALAEEPLFLAHPLITIVVDENTIGKIQELIKRYKVKNLVVGRPRNLQGNDTPQTVSIAEYVKNLQLGTDTSIIWQDESLTSVKAEEELLKRGKNFTKEAVDALAATYILEDYVREHL